MKVKSLFLVALLLILTRVSQALLVWLWDGTLIHGEILDYNEHILTLRRLDTEGVIEIPWEELHPESLFQVRKYLGLIEPEEKTMDTTIEGVKVYLKSGGVVEGKKLRQSQTHLILKYKGGTLPIPLSNIYEVEKTKLLLTQVYRPKELYCWAQKRYDLKSGQGNLEAAKFFLALGQYEQAQRQLQKAQKIAPKLATQIQALSKKLQRAIKKDYVRKQLQRVYGYKGLRRYHKARSILEKLRDKISLEEWQKINESLQEEQDSYFQEKIPKLWFEKLGRKLYNIASKREIELAQARGYVDSMLEKELASELAKEFSISEDEVIEYFQKRTSSRVLRHSYRDGTFIVGLGSYGSQGLKTLSKTLALYNKIMADDSTTLATPEEWWQRASISTRKEWLWAYYCEHKLKIVGNKLKPCLQCGGQGVLKKGIRKVICKQCHGLKYERVVIAK